MVDVDDTLLTTRAAMSRAAATAFAELWPSVDPDRALLAGQRFRADPEGYFRAFTRGELDFATMRTRRVEAAARFLGHDVPDGARDRFHAAYEPVFQRLLRAYDDAVPLLHRVTGAGLALGALTNSGRDYTAGKLAAAGLDRLLPVVVTRDTLGFGKPDPRVFEHACSELGTRPGETVYVGDEYDVDVLGALGAGVRAVWLARDEPDPALLADARARDVPVVSGLDELPARLGF
ncbi:HAD family hydrolase [Nocardioides marmoribigeumensis]|uniref:HAD family hydrolase n=1 Tax=Nocardioides marmoribigeumensis TaxID=433649 RepID=UPI0031CE23D6